MFTGIINAVGEVKAAKRNKSGMVLAVQKPGKWKVKLGDSITVNGVCSTVKKLGRVMEFEYMPESLAKSNLGDLKVHHKVNLEQSLRASDRLDGHIVQGHVDTVGKIIAITPEGNSFVFKIQSPQLKLVAPKGAIAVEGISLTVVDVGKNFFTIKIIPYTMQHTNLGTKKAGDTVNLEFDVLAKYLERMNSFKK